MPIKDFVESISWKRWGWKGMETKPGAIPSAVRSWYSEIKHGYDYNTGLPYRIFLTLVYSQRQRPPSNLKVTKGY